MASAINVGSINLPKMMRQIKHRTSQVRDLVFVRDPVYRKETKTTGQSNLTEGAGSTLAGPAVNFGYETSSYAQQDAGVDLAYHVNTPEIVLPGLTMLQSPIASRSGSLERGGHRITGACTFYAPSLDYIKALDNFKNAVAFSELESYDKLYDMERIIETKPDDTSTSTLNFNVSFGFTNPTSGYEIDRIQFKVRAPPIAGTIQLDYVLLTGYIGGVEATLKWDGNLTLSGTAFTTIDLPISNVEATDTTSIYKDGVRAEYTAAITGGFDVDKTTGIDSDNRLSGLDIKFAGAGDIYIKDIYLYKEAEWRIESIKDYRDEYMQIAAVRVRGDRASRRRTYG
jgi:hypothetical protein